MLSKPADDRRTGDPPGPEPRRGVTRPFAALVAAVLLLGIADSMYGSYAVLFAADEIGLSPLEVGVFASAQAIGGIVVSSVLGRRFDRRPSRSYAVAAAISGALGLAALTVTRALPLLVLLAVSLLGAVAAAFPQLFTVARVVLGDGRAGERSAPLLRSAWSLAWAIGPLLGAAVLARSGFPAILLTAAVLLVATAGVTLAVPAPGRPAGGPVDEPAAAGAPARSAALATASIVLFFTAMYAGSLALPLFVTRALHQPDSSVGVLFSVCAAVEVLAALALAALPGRVGQRALILGGMAAFVLYFLLTVLASGLGLLLIGQVARGVAIAVVGSAGIRFFQELLAPATGRATTLFSNAATAGSLVAGVLAGVALRTFGYQTTLLLCGAAAAAATAVLWTDTVLDRRRTGGRPATVPP
jgi:SET family sugar efflux transporter-like MFS transporter